MATKNNNVKNVGVLVGTLTTYVKNWQKEHGKGMIDTQNGEIDVVYKDLEGRVMGHLKAIRVKNGILELAYNRDYKLRYKPTDFKNDANWEDINSGNIILESSLLDIIGQITKF